MKGKNCDNMYNQNSFLMSEYTRVGGEIFRTDMIQEMLTSSAHQLFYLDDLSKMQYTVDAASTSYPIYVVLTLRYHHETLIKRILAEIKASGLYDKTTRIFLRFEEEPNRKIVNFCKLNFDKVEIHSSSNYSIMDFLEVRFKEGGKYILCFDVTEQESEALQDMLILHHIEEWKYCMQLLIDNHDHCRAVGLFPSPSSHDFWFHTFWIRSEAGSPFRTITKKEKRALLKCSNGEWFTDLADIQNSVFDYGDRQTENAEEEKVPLSTGSSEVHDRSRVYPSAPAMISRASSDSPVIFPSRSSS